jgi:predicted nucleic acid-binding protein
VRDPEGSVKPIADTGVIVALLAADDPCHAWAAEAFRRHSPFFTCDAVVAEACGFFPDPRPVLTLISRGDLVLDFNLAEHMPRVLALVAKYADQPLDLADACLVTMTELHHRCQVWNVDRSDFLNYRRHGLKLSRLSSRQIDKRLMASSPSVGA